ncbi:MAG: DUF2127 domain-containing protein, partial [Acidimicrobiia bacterium]|nr:DUF2127 domain-containing protein [Acidimicrobiia bacterium]
MTSDRQVSDGDGDRQRFVLRLIAAERFLRAAFLVAVGIVLMTHVHTDWGRMLRDEATRWGLHPSQGALGRALRRVSALRPATVGAYGAVAVGYGVLEGVEGYGLWRQRRWGEVLTVVATSLLFIPEVWELTKRVSAFKAIALLVNVVIV